LGLLDGDRPGYRTRISRERGLGGVVLREHWQVHCMLSLTVGDNDVAPLRAEAVALLDLLDAALRVQVVLDGVWQRAALDGQMDWIPLLGPSGAAMTVIFDIEGESLT
jgi:hypothetical protein